MTLVPPPPPPPPEPEPSSDMDFEGKLSFVVLSDDNKSILLNGNPDYSLALALNFSKKKAKDRQKVVESLVYNGCASYGLDYVGQDNVRNLAKEVVDQTYERRRVVKQLSVSEVTRHNSGEWTIPKVKIVGVSPPYKMISAITMRCDTCRFEQTEDYSDKPLMSYKQTEKSCNVCVKSGAKGKDVGSLITTPDHIEAQSITVQESETHNNDDQKRLHVILLEDLINNIRVGEIVTITGEMTVLNPYGLGNKKATAAMYAHDIKYEREEESPITDDDIILFQSFAKEHGVKTPNELVKMFAPQVIGHNDAKLGILRSIVSVKEAKHITGFRTRVHTDLAGDPGTVKTTLAYEATMVARNAEWVTSDHATIKSTLAIVDKDPDSGAAMLMLGPIPRAKNSICGIDEIGSTPFEDQQHYGNVLEEGLFIKIAYGRDYEIDAQTTIICTTNPNGGYWDKNRPPSLDQIPIKSNIKDRLDQHYIFQDYQTDEECTEFAMQKTENYLNPESVKPDYDFLKRYLEYAASLPVPKLTPEAASMLSFFWQRMRMAGYISNRSFDALYRIALAQSRLHLKSEVDVATVKEVMQDMQIMYVKLGKVVDPAVEDPRILAHNEVIQYVNTLTFPIEFIEALKHVYEHNDLIKQYLGHNNNNNNTVEWRVDDNKKIRAIHDKFTDGGTGQLKIGSRGLAVAVHGIRPLTLVKAEVPKEQRQMVENQQKSSEGAGSERSDRSVNTGNNSPEDANDKKNPSTADLTDLSDLNIDSKELQIYAILQTLLKDNKETFTEQDWMFNCSIWPNLGWSVAQMEQVFKQLLQQGRIMELEGGGGFYKPTQKLSMGGGSQE